MAKTSVNGERYVAIVRGVLEAHASRGALRQFDETSARGKTEFRFTWLLDRKFVLVMDPANARLVLKDLLPHVPARSDLDASIREFIEGRTARALPAHRRIDPARVTVSCINQKGSISFRFDVKRNQYKYAVGKVLGFCNELFGFLDMKHIQYLWAHMGVPEE